MNCAIYARVSTRDRGQDFTNQLLALTEFAAKQGWLIITRDRHIQDHPAEIAAVRDHGAKMVALSAADAGSTWNQLEVVMANWRRFEGLVEQVGPFIWRATRSGLGKVNLD